MYRRKLPEKMPGVPGLVRVREAIADRSEMIGHIGIGSSKHRDQPPLLAIRLEPFRRPRRLVGGVGVISTARRTGTAAENPAVSSQARHFIVTATCRAGAGHRLPGLLLPVEIRSDIGTALSANLADEMRRGVRTSEHRPATDRR